MSSDCGPPTCKIASLVEVCPPQPIFKLGILMTFAFYFMHPISGESLAFQAERFNSP